MKDTWLSTWTPEDESFWENSGKKIAWRTLTITTISLVISFCTWYIMSVIVVRLPQIGFTYTKMQLFWLAAMPGLAGGTLRIIHTFLVPVFGTRKVIIVATLLKLIPCIGIGIVVRDVNTSFAVFMVLAFMLGFGGGDFSSYMPSTSIFFPKRLQGTALGIQAGIGNFGVSLAQFLTPWIIGFSVFGGLGGGPQTLTKAGETSSVWLQNASYIYIIPLIIMTAVSWWKLKSVPIKASFREQFDIFHIKHTWFCTVTYLMTFGIFAGLSAVFPLLTNILYGGFDGAPDPLKYAFYGPLVGSLTRILFGPVTDKFGGAILTHITGIALIICLFALIFMGLLTPVSVDQFPAFLTVILFIFFFTGIGNAATFRQFPVIFSSSPRQAAGVIGWTAAIAAYGPFLFSILIGYTIEAAGNTIPFFYGLIVLCVIATSINWWYYTRKGCEKPS
ncbi:MFS transporter [Arcticibacter eurypsychrophilus]|uniref:MFS transporter n=1 Tax=Arcticibacter eurypsychrophilus TaxID=1434752 RepID=UPI00084D4311|nr:nitrate/nitrite transporter [Arcticibacter eurypsychrophilus]